MTLTEVCWDDRDTDWSRFAAAVIGTTWDYWDRQEEFLATLRAIGGSTKLFNPASLVHWNSHKSYLRDLAEKGAELIPTLWLEEATPEAVEDAFAKLGSDDLVLKRQVGAGADGQHRIRRGDTIPIMPAPMMAQPFLPEITTEGELSFVFIDGQLSHALRKRPKPGDYRIQSSFGGYEEAVELSESDTAAASAILKMLDEIPLYARVDMLRGGAGNLLLMELELIEPYLYPEQGLELGERFATALQSRLGNP